MQYKINWREHIQRMDDSRNLGRPQTRWGNDFWEEGTCQGA